MALLARGAPCLREIMFGHSVQVTRRGHPSLTHLITQPDVGRGARLPAKVSMAVCLLLGSGSYNRELCLYSPVLPQSLLILSRLPATPAALWFSSSPSFDSGALCLRRPLCFFTLSSLVWNPELCLPSDPNPPGRALPRWWRPGSVSVLV